MGLVIVMVGFLDGVIMGMVDSTAYLDTGHLRLVNKPFYDEEHLNPMDRALGAQKMIGDWLKKHSDPKIEWSPRIRWRAIMDVVTRCKRLTVLLTLLALACALFINPVIPTLTLTTRRRSYSQKD